MPDWNNSYTEITSTHRSGRYLQTGMATQATSKSSGRLTLRNLLRDPASTVTLTPAYAPDQVESPLNPEYEAPSSVPVTGILGTSSEAAARSKRGAKAAAGSADRTKMSNRGGPDAGWGFPPPSPMMYHQGYSVNEMRQGESSTSGSMGRRETGSPGAMSAYSQTTQTGGKRRRRESQAETADTGPELEDEGAMGSRPLAITCAPCRTRKVKCDSGKPVCGNCAKSPNECYYPVKLKPGLRPGTGTDMARRLGQSCTE